MRILYIDIDTLRADHLGCYGYHRKTSPTSTIWRGKACALITAMPATRPAYPRVRRCGAGVLAFIPASSITAADPFIEGPTRGFRDIFGAAGCPLTWSGCAPPAAPTTLKRWLPVTPTRCDQTGMFQVSCEMFVARASARCCGDNGVLAEYAPTTNQTPNWNETHLDQMILTFLQIFATF